jgi:hypothetical protein
LDEDFEGGNQTTNDTDDAGKDDKKGFLPGFEVAVAGGALALAFVASRRKK